MIINKETLVTKDLANKKIVVVREFDAPVDQVWKAWTKSELLDQWWVQSHGKHKQKQWILKKAAIGCTRWSGRMVPDPGAGPISRRLIH